MRFGRPRVVVGAFVGVGRERSDGCRLGRKDGFGGGSWGCPQPGGLFETVCLDELSVAEDARRLAVGHDPALFHHDLSLIHI